MEAIQPPTGVNLEAKRAAFQEEMQLQYFSPPGGEKVTQAFILGASHAIEHVPAYGALLDIFLTSEKNPNPSYLVNKFFKTHQYELIRPGVREELDYPRRFLSADVWKNYIAETYNDPQSPAYLRLKEKLQHGRLQTSRGSRANAPAFIIAADYKNQPFTTPRTILEGGSAAGSILQELIIGPAGNVIVVDQEGIERSEYTELFRKNIRKLRRVKVKGGYAVERCVGVEINPPLDEDGKLFMKACSNDPSQLDRDVGSSPRERAVWVKQMLINPNPHEVETVRGHEVSYDSLEAVKIAGLDILEGDYMQLREADEKRLRDNPADYAIFSLFIEQIVSQGLYAIKDIERVTEPRVKEGAKLIVTGYAEVDRDGELRILDRWYRAKYLCSTFLLDLGEPPAKRRWRTLMHWETSSCRQVKMGRDIDWLAPEFVEIATDTRSR